MGQGVHHPKQGAHRQLERVSGAGGDEEQLEDAVLVADGVGDVLAGLQHDVEEGDGLGAQRGELGQVVGVVELEAVGVQEAGGLLPVPHVEVGHVDGGRAGDDAAQRVEREHGRDGSADQRPAEITSTALATSTG